MKNAQAKVASFMSVKDSNLPTNPVIPDRASRELRFRLIDEEITELKDAFATIDIVGVADALGDILYLVLGTAVDCGIDIEPVFNEIHRSNMTKFIGGLKLRADGKIAKGPDYQPPNLKPIIAGQVNALAMAEIASEMYG